MSREDSEKNQGGDFSKLRRSKDFRRLQFLQRKNQEKIRIKKRGDKG